MSILDRSALEQSPLADLHAIASELSIDGYRRLRKPQLIDAILARQEGEPDDRPPADADTLTDTIVEELEIHDEGRPSARRRRGRRGGARTRSTATREPSEDEQPEAEAPEEEAETKPSAERTPDEVVEGVVELLPNGSGFMRVSPPEPSDDDVYISAAQVKRCDLVSGDRISGPRRTPRRSERFASLIRVDTINGRPAAEVADSAHFDELPVAFPSRPFHLGSADPTLAAIESHAPFGRGSRVVLAGRAQTGKTEALRRLAAALAGQEDLQVLVALIGVRPEEIPEWSPEPAAALNLGASADAQAQALERVIDQGRRLAARGGHAVVLVDALDGVPAAAARKALAAARSIRDAGSLTVVAAAAAPLGGETTVVTLTAPGRVDEAQSWTMHPELLASD